MNKIILLWYVRFAISRSIRTVSMSTKYLKITGFVLFVKHLGLQVSIFHAPFVPSKEEPWSKLISEPINLLVTADTISSISLGSDQSFPSASMLLNKWEQDQTSLYSITFSKSRLILNYSRDSMKYGYIIHVQQSINRHFLLYWMAKL